MQADDGGALMSWCMGASMQAGQRGSVQAGTMPPSSTLYICRPAGQRLHAGDDPDRAASVAADRSRAPAINTSEAQLGVRSGARVMRAVNLVNPGKSVMPVNLVNCG